MLACFVLFFASANLPADPILLLDGSRHNRLKPDISEAMTSGLVAISSAKDFCS